MDGGYLLKLYRCLDHALKIPMWFGYNPHCNFFLTFSKFELKSFFRHLHSESACELDICYSKIMFV